MSYILDALTKSQRERQRQALPTLATDHALVTGSSHARTHGPAMWLATSTLAAIVVAYALARAWSSMDPAPARALDAALPNEPIVAEPARPAALPAPAREAAKAPPPAPARPTARATAEAQPVESPVPALASAPPHPDAFPAPPAQPVSPETLRLKEDLIALARQADAAAGTRPASTPQPPPGEAPGAIGAQAAPARSSAASDPPPVARASAETLATLPPLVVNAHAYAESPDERMIIVNMKRYGEGDRMREGPVVESITPGGAVLSYGDQRFELPAR